MRFLFFTKKGAEDAVLRSVPLDLQLKKNTG